MLLSERYWDSLLWPHHNIMAAIFILKLLIIISHLHCFHWCCRNGSYSTSQVLAIVPYFFITAIECLFTTSHSSTPRCQLVRNAARVCSVFFSRYPFENCSVTIFFAPKFVVLFIFLNHHCSTMNCVLLLGPKLKICSTIQRSPG